MTIQPDLMKAMALCAVATWGITEATKPLLKKWIADAWKRSAIRLCALLRMMQVPAVVTSNYLLGATRLKMRPFLIGTYFGCLPMSLLMCYIGTQVDSVE